MLPPVEHGISVVFMDRSTAIVGGREQWDSRLQTTEFKTEKVQGRTASKILWSGWVCQPVAVLAPKDRGRYGAFYCTML